MLTAHVVKHTIELQLVVSSQTLFKVVQVVSFHLVLASIFKKLVVQESFKKFDITLLTAYGDCFLITGSSFVVVLYSC